MLRVHTGGGLQTVASDTSQRHVTKHENPWPDAVNLNSRETPEFQARKQQQKNL